MRRSPITNTPIFFLPKWVLFWCDAFAPLSFAMFIRSEHKDDVRALSVLILHEEQHFSQQRDDGKLRWLWRYVTSREWRVWYEVDAYAKEIAWYMRQPGYDIEMLSDFFARLLRKWSYFLFNRYSREYLAIRMEARARHWMNVGF
jgi:hypothetical protein